MDDRKAAEKVIRDSGLTSVLQLGKVLDELALARQMEEFRSNQQVYFRIFKFDSFPHIALSLAKFMESLTEEEDRLSFSNTRLLTARVCPPRRQGMRRKSSRVLEAISQPEMTDGGAVAVDIVPSRLIWSTIDPMTATPWSGFPEFHKDKQTRIK